MRVSGSRANFKMWISVALPEFNSIESRMESRNLLGFINLSDDSHADDRGTSFPPTIIVVKTILLTDTT